MHPVLRALDQTLQTRSRYIELEGQTKVAFCCCIKQGRLQLSVRGHENVFEKHFTGDDGRCQVRWSDVLREGQVSSTALEEPHRV